MAKSKNTWFDDVFLTSLFERAGVDNAIWITNKQRQVCLDYFRNYVYIWQNRTIKLYPCKNGAAQIYFCHTEKEYQTFLAQHKIDDRKKHLTRLQELKKRAENGNEKAFERVKNEIARLKELIQNFKQDITEDYEIEYAEKKIVEIQEDLAILLN